VVESSGRDALVELRRIVGVLRRGSDELAGASAPGLSQLDALIDRAHASGLPVVLHFEGRRPLPPGLDLVAYRVVQEALTNVIKHAGPVPTVVNVKFTARDLELEVSDSGRGPALEREDRDGPGHGLLGMGERVAYSTAVSSASGHVREAGLRSARGSRWTGRRPHPKGWSRRRLGLV
jgi:signal transduction histidine kinase